MPNLDCSLAYKTGDIAKWDENGIINFVGRNDNQIKINGHRVELNEIEKAINNYEHIKKVVALKQEIGNRKFITAYFTSEKRIAIAQLRKYLTNYLPNYMCLHLNELEYKFLFDCNQINLIFLD